MSETRSRSTWKLWVGILIGVLVTLAVLAALAVVVVLIATESWMGFLQRRRQRLIARAGVATGPLHLRPAA